MSRTPKRGVGGSNPLVDGEATTFEHFGCGRFIMFVCWLLRYAIKGSLKYDFPFFMGFKLSFKISM